MDIESLKWTDHTYLLAGVPADTGYVYELVGSAGLPIYIGQTTRPIHARWAEHVSAKGPALAQVLKIISTEVPRKELDQVEALLIHHYHPPLNRRCPTEGCALYKVQDSRAQELRCELSATETTHLRKVVRAIARNTTGDLQASYVQEVIRADGIFDLDKYSENLIGRYVSEVLGKSVAFYSAKAGKTVRGWPASRLQELRS